MRSTHCNRERILELLTNGEFVTNGIGMDKFKIVGQSK